MKQVLPAAAIGIAVLAPLPAFADGFFAGLGAARTDTPFDAKSRTAPKLFGGYEVNDQFGFEIGITRTPVTRFTTTQSGPTAPAPVTRTFRSNTVYLAGKAAVPITDRFGFVAKFGVVHSRNKTAVSTAPASAASASASATGLYAAFGLQYKITEKTTVSVEVERNGRKRVLGAKPQTISINANYRF